MFDKLTEIIVNYVEVKREDIKPESRFMEDLGFTSFDFMSMLGEIEEALDVEIDQEEAANIRNAFGFARKVLVTGECDLLILDEILGLVDLGLVTTEDVRGLLNARDDSMGLVITGIHRGEELMPYVDRVYEITSLKKV